MQCLTKVLSRLPKGGVQQCIRSPNPNMLAMSMRGIDTLYTAETCEDCVDSYAMPGPRDDLKRLEAPDRTKNKDPCWQSLRRTEYKCRTDPEFLLDSFIDSYKKCLEDPCAWDVPRADLTHYRPSDKLKRHYPRTWVKCVIKKRKAKMQCYCKPVPPQRRKKSLVVKKQCPEPCTLGSIDLGLGECPKPENNPCCPRITSPGCKPAKVPPKCRRGHRPPKDCRKRLTKYPSFSECLMDPLPDAPPIECNCLATPSMCSVWEYYRNKKS